MQFNDYSTKAISTLTDKDSHKYGDVDARLMAQILGLSGESGEVMEKFKKILRDKNGEISENDRDAIIKELVTCYGMLILWLICLTVVWKKWLAETTTNCLVVRVAARFTVAEMIANF